MNSHCRSNKEEEYGMAVKEHEALLEEGYNTTNITLTRVPAGHYLLVFTGLTVGVFLFSLVRALFVFHLLVRSARKLHNSMFWAVIRAPMLFFDSNPSGMSLCVDLKITLSTS